MVLRRTTQRIWLKHGHFDTLDNLKHWYYTELYKPLNKYIKNTNNYHTKAWQTQKGGTKYAFKAYSYADLNNTFNINKRSTDHDWYIKNTSNL